MRLIPTRTLAALLAVLSFTASAGHRVVDVVSRMPEPEQRAFFSDLLTKGGKACTAERVFFQGVDPQDFAYWNVACREKTAFSMRFRNDERGSSQIMDCASLKPGSKAECFKKL